MPKRTTKTVSLRATPPTRPLRASAAADKTELEGIVAAIGRSQAVIEFDLDGTIRTANENFLKAMGYSIEEVRGRHHSMFVDEPLRNAAAYREFWEKLNRGEFHAGEFKRLGKGGRESMDPSLLQSGARPCGQTG